VDSWISESYGLETSINSKTKVLRYFEIVSIYTCQCAMRICKLPLINILRLHYKNKQCADQSILQVARVSLRYYSDFSETSKVTVCILFK
jgi:hypothetical protein